MSGTQIVTEIVNILVAGITQLGTGIGAGISNFAQALAFSGTGENQTLSVYFVLVIVFAGVSLARILVLLPVMAFAKLLNCWETSRRQSAAKPFDGKVQRLALCA